MASASVSYSLEAHLREFDVGLHSVTLRHDNKTWQEMGSAAAHIVGFQLWNIE